MNLCLIFGYHAVIGASSFDSVCEYTRRFVTAASDRAAATGSMPLSDDDISKMSELFFDISLFAEKKTGSSAIQRLELGAVDRNGFVLDARVEFEQFVALVIGSDVDEMGFRGKYAAILDGGFQSCLKQVYDPECILCVIEKTPLRKNVLNLIHFLRTKFQDVRIGVVCNNWEGEGVYMANTMAARRTGMPVFIPGTCPQEYREQNDTFKSNRFTTDGLFDVVVQSHIEKSRKPSVTMLKSALESLTEMSSIPGDASRSKVFVFEGRAQNVKAAMAVPGVTRTYHVSNGAADIYRGVCEALKEMGTSDSQWATAYAQFTRVIGPLFQRNLTEGWRRVETDNTDGNMLFLPPPIDPRLDKVEGVIVGPIQRAVLVDLRDHLPQCFPLTESEITSACGRGIGGGAAGPVLFERYKQNILPDAYRITLQTGSFIVRIEPKGGPKAAALMTLSQNSSIPNLIQAGIAYSQGGVALAKTYRVAKELAKSTHLPIAEGLAFVASEVNGIGRDFTVQRYVDNRTVNSVRELVEATVVRGYSQSRTKARFSPSPSLFVDAALDVMTRLHAAPIPQVLSDRFSRISTSADCPLLILLKECDAMCRKQTRPEPLETLGRLLLGYCEKFRPASHYCMTHGFLSLESFMFSPRSLEGNPEFPIKILAVSNVSGCDVGDPLLDLAALTLMTKAPVPEGIVGLPVGAKQMFPTEDDMIGRYVTKAAQNGVSNLSSKSEIKDILSIYQASHCYRRGCVLFSGMGIAKLSTEEAERRLRLVVRSANLGLSILSTAKVGKCKL